MTAGYDATGSLFETGPQQLFVDAEGGVVYRPGFVDAATAARWFAALREGVAWQAQRRPMYDRVVDVPRLTAAITPSGIARAMAMIIAAMASSAVAGTRSTIIVVTGCPVRKERPKSPVTAWRRNVTY